MRTDADLLIMAALRNLTISLHRLNGESNIAAALRRHAVKRTQPLDFIGAYLN